MADRKLELNISSDSKALQADLVNLLTQLNQLNKTAVTFNTALTAGFAKVAIEQEKLNQAIAQTQVIQERAAQSAIKTAAEQQKANAQAVIDKEKLAQAAAKTVASEEQAAQAAIKRAAADQQAATQKIADIAKIQQANEKAAQAALKTSADQQKAIDQQAIAQQRAAQTALKSSIDQQKAADQQSATQQKAADQSAIAQQRIAQATANRQITEARLQEQIKRTAAAAEQANKIQNEGLGISLKGLQSNLFALNNLRFGLQTLGLIASGIFQSATGQAQQLEKQILGLTGTFASLNQVFSSGVNLSDPLAKINALEPAIESSIAKVRQISLTISGVTSSQLVGVFQTIAQNSGAANLSLDQSVQLVKSFSAGLVSANIPLFQQRQEIDSILKGQINQDSTLAKQLGITNAIIEREKARGNLVGFLNERLKTSVIIQEKFSQTIEGASSNIVEIAELTQSAFGGQLLKPITDTLNAFYKFLDTNKDKIFGFAEFLGNQFVLIGASVKDVFDAIAPRLALIGEFIGSLATIGIQTFTGAFSTLASVLATVDSALNVVLIPTLKLLNSDLGLVIVSAGLLTYALKAALLPAIGNILQSFALAASSVVAAIGGIGSLIVAYTAESVAVNTLSGAYAKLAAAKVVAQAGSAALAVLSGGLITIAISAAAALAILVVNTKQLEEQNKAVESANTLSDASFAAGQKTLTQLKGLAEQRAKNGALSKEEEALEKRLQATAKTNSDRNVLAINHNKELIRLYPALRETLEPVIKVLEKQNEQLSNLSTQGLKVAKIGDAFSYLAQQAKTALNVIKAGVNQEDFDRRSKEILDLTKQQLDLGLITREDAIKNLQVLANAEDAKVELRASANKQILAIIKEFNKEEVELNKQKQSELEQLAASGYISEVESLERISELRKRNLEIESENTRKANEKIAKDSVKFRFEALSKAEAELAALKSTKPTGDAIANANNLKAIEKQQIAIKKIKDTFDEQDLKDQQKFASDEAKIRADKLKAEKDDIDKKVKSLRSSLDRELEENSNLRKKAEFALQADLQALRLGGFENEKQFEEESLLLKKGNIESELFDKRRSLEFDKIALTNSRLSLQEKEALVLSISKKELDIAKLNLDATDNLIARTKVLYDVKIMGIEREKESLDKVSKLLQSQNDLQTARIGLVRAVQDAELKAGEARLDGLRDVAALLKQNSDFVADKAKREADNQLKAKRDGILKGLNEEQTAEAQKRFAAEDSARAEADAKAEQAKSDQLNLEKQQLLRTRLNELGFSAGSNELAISRQIFEQEQKNLGLKARQFESTQIAEQRSLAIQQQMAAIKDRQLNAEAQIALQRAEASGDESQIRKALENVNLTKELIGNNQQLFKIQKDSLEVNQTRDLNAFNLGQGNEQYKARLAGIESGLTANSVIGSNPDIKAAAFSFDQANRKGQTIIPIASEQGATGAIKANQDANTKKVLDARSQNLANVANGATAFKNTSEQIAKNFERLPKALNETSKAILEAASFAKQLSENPLFKLREDAKKEEQKSAKVLADEAKKTALSANPTNTKLNKLFSLGAAGLPESRFDSPSGKAVDSVIQKDKDVVTQNTEIKQSNAFKSGTFVNNLGSLGGVGNGDLLNSRLKELERYKDFGVSPDAINAAANLPKESESYKAYIKQFKRQEADWRRKKAQDLQNRNFLQIGAGLGFFTGGLPPVDTPVTVNERGQEAVTNLQTLETSLLPNGERTVQFDAPVWVHNASETKQLGSLGVFDPNQLPNINFGAIAATLRINNSDIVRELRTLRSELAASMSRPNQVLSPVFNNVERPDLQMYRLQQQLLRS